MASEAEVDLIISTADALPQLERDLTDIVRAAEADADSVELQALLDAEDSLARLIDDLGSVIRDAELSGDPIQIEATLDQAESLANLQDDLHHVIEEAQFAADEIQLDAALDADIAALDAEIAALVNELEASAPEVDIQVDVDRDHSAAASVSRLGKLFSGLAGPARIAGLGIGGIAAAGASLPSTVALLGSVVTAVEQLAPASALAVSGLSAIALAGGAVKLAMSGVGDAVKGAFDPNTKPEDLAKAMESLSPSARAFVTELTGMRSQLKDIQQTVQQRFFEGLDQSLKGLATATLPIFKAQLSTAATTLNTMAKGAAQAAQNLGTSGVLGKALDGANKGLTNLAGVPALAVTALGQIGAAAGPAFDRVTKGAAGAADSISAKLNKAFESGALEKAINGAIDTFKQLGRIGSNVLSGLKNILGTLTSEGNGLFGTLEKVTKAFSEVTATKGFQDAIRALSQTLNVVVATVLPLLSQTLQALGPVFVALAGPVQTLVKSLGAALGPVIAALSPVLVVLAGAFGKLVGLITPFITLAGQLLTAILPALTPLFSALGTALSALAPFAQQLASTLAAALVPLFTTLATQVLPQLLPALIQLSTAIFPVLVRVITAMAPVLVQLASTFGQLLVALTPVVVELINMTVTMVNQLMPIIEPLIALILKLVTGALNILSSQITGVVIPVLHILVDLMKGDFSAAFTAAKDLIASIWNKIVELTGAFVGSIADKLLSLVGLTRDRVSQIRDRAVEGFQDMVSRAASEVGKLPGRLLSALGDLKSLLVSAGSDAVQGFINGLSSRLSRLREIASDIASTVKNAVGDFLRIGSPSRLMREYGQWTAEGFGLGIQDRLAELSAHARSMAAVAPAAVGGLQMSPQVSAAPTVQVFLGNEMLNGHVDARIAQNDQMRDRLIINGGRR